MSDNNTNDTTKETGNTVVKNKVDPLKDKVEIMLAPDRDGKPSFVPVGVGEYSAVIKRGEKVKVPRFVIPVLENSGEYVTVF